MAGDTVIQGSQPVEYVEETTFATDETNPAMQWIGAVTGFSVTQGVEVETVRYLPDDATGTNLQKLTNEKVGEAYEVEVTYAPQDLTFFQYAMGGVGSLSNNLSSIQFGEQDLENAQFRRITGAVCSELSLNIDEDSVAEVSATFTAADANDWSGTDYIGTSGSHATESTATPLKYSDLANVNYGGTALPDAVSSLSLTISNDLAVVKDPDAAPKSNIASITPTSREVTTELDLTYDDMSMAQTVRTYADKDLTFDWGPTAETWTVADTKFPEFPYEFGPEDLVGDSVSSDPATDLSYV